MSDAAIADHQRCHSIRNRPQDHRRGLFVLPLLPAGEYTVTVTATGFETLTQSHVIVDALATVGLNPKLQFGAATQSVTVQDQPAILKADDVALGLRCRTASMMRFRSP